MRLSEAEKSYFLDCMQETMKSGELQQLNSFTQHCGMSRLDHSVSVAYYSYQLSVALNLNVDEESMIRGALLHDNFQYDWHEETGRKGAFINLFTHPREALKMSQQNFNLNSKEKDIILRHMWPLTVIPPKTRESLIVCMMDKYCTLKEIFRRRRLTLNTVEA